MLYTGYLFHERSNIIASFAEHLKLQGKLNSTYLLSLKCGKTLKMKLELGRYKFWKCYIQGAS